VKGPRILQINYRLDGTAAEYLEANKPYAEPIAQTPGLRWKIWLLNEVTKEAGGIYLFDSDASDPTASFKEFDVPRELSAVTRAPV
jgi:hypothetical protein